MKGPQFLIYIRPLVEVLRNSGGSGSTADIIDQVINFKLFTKFIFLILKKYI